MVIGSFLIKVTFLSQMSTSSRNLNHHWKCREQKENFQIILVIIFCNFTIFQYRSDSPQVKGNLVSSIANLVCELPHELPNDLRFRMSENQEILEKSQIWVGTQPSAQSPFKNLDFANTSQKTRKNRYQTFHFLHSFSGLLYFVPNILFGIF